MQAIIKFFSGISGFGYLVYLLIILFIFFAIIGYLVTEKHNSSK